MVGGPLRLYFKALFSLGGFCPALWFVQLSCNAEKKKIPDATPSAWRDVLGSCGYAARQPRAPPVKESVWEPPPRRAVVQAEIHRLFYVWRKRLQQCKNDFA